MRSAAALGAADPVRPLFHILLLGFAARGRAAICGGAALQGRAGSGALPGCSSRRRHPPRTRSGARPGCPWCPHPTLTPPPPAGPSVLSRLGRPLAASASAPDRIESFQLPPGFVQPSPIRRSRAAGAGRALEGMAALSLGKCFSPAGSGLTVPILFCGWFWAVGWLAGGQARSLLDALRGRGRRGVTHPARRLHPA